MARIHYHLPQLDKTRVGRLKCGKTQIMCSVEGPLVLCPLLSSSSVLPSQVLHGVVCSLCIEQPPAQPRCEP